MNQNQHDPKNPDSAWEEAMSRDFDARVRDLHEAPLDFESVKGKAHKIRRKRRAAVAGGVLAVAAVITPVAVLASNNGDPRSNEPDFADPPPPSETAAAPGAGVDFVLKGTWHQADGDEVELPENDQPYQAAVLWNGNLVTTRWDGEVYSTAIVVAEDGTLLDTFPTTGPVVVNDAGTTAAWVDTGGNVVVGTDVDDETVIGTVDLAAAGETAAWVAAAVTGGPSCLDDVEGCTVFLDNQSGDPPTTMSSTGSSGNEIPGARSYADATTVGGATATYIDTLNDDNTVCGGLYDLDADSVRWHTCDFNPKAISPDGDYVVGAPTYGDGLGDPQVDILDAGTGESTGQYAPEGGFVSTDVAWSDTNTLVLSAYDGAKWHLLSMAPGGAVTELTDARGPAEDSPFVIVQH